MYRYIKNPAFTMVYVPGYGRVREGVVLEGQHFASFCPVLLVPAPASLEEEQGPESNGDNETGPTMDDTKTPSRKRNRKA